MSGNREGEEGKSKRKARGKDIAPWGRKAEMDKGEKGVDVRSCDAPEGRQGQREVF